MAAGLACTKANRVDLLVSGTGVADTDVDDAAKGVSGSASAALTGNAVATPYNWAGGANTNTPALAERATVDDQLITNTTVAYTGVNFTGGGGPRVGLGWRGAYLTGPAGLDPWGYRYQANTVFLGVASDAAAGGAEGNADGGWSYDSMVLSAGTNGMVETAFGPAGGTASGDDVIYVIKGSTR
jgi:hypothetical protein